MLSHQENMSSTPAPKKRASSTKRSTKKEKEPMHPVDDPMSPPPSPSLEAMDVDTTVLLPGFTEARCEEVDERYGLRPVTPQIRIAAELQKTTKISDVFTGGVDLAHPFLDEAKREKRVVPTMIQRLSTDGQLPNETTMSCFWCRHPFATPPIGCPVRFVPSQLCKRYVSEITKDPYLIKENLTSPAKAAKIMGMDKPDGISIALVDRDYYETDGVFCSFNCCLAFIDGEKNNPMYAQSRQLLFKMYTDTYEKFPTDDDIIKAPHWRLLSAYGGHLSIQEFRSSFNTVTFSLYNRIATRPKMQTLGFLFEEKHKF